MVKKGNTKKSVKQTVEVIDEVGFLIDPSLLDLEGKNKYLNCLTILSDKTNLKKLKDLIDRLNLSPETNEYLTEINETADKSIFSEIIEYFRIKKDIVKYSLVLDILNHNHIGNSQFMNYDRIHSFYDQISCDKTAFDSILRIPQVLSSTDMDIETKARSCIFCYIDKPVLSSIFDNILSNVLPNIVSLKKRIIQTLDFELYELTETDETDETDGYLPAKYPVNNLQYSLFLSYLKSQFDEKLLKKENILFYEDTPLIDFSLSSIEYKDGYIFNQDENKYITGVYPASLKLYAEFVSSVLKDNVKVCSFHLENNYSFFSGVGARILLPNFMTAMLDLNKINEKETLLKEVILYKDKYYKLKNGSLTVNNNPQKDLTFRLMKKAEPVKVIETKTKKNNK